TNLTKSIPIRGRHGVPAFGHDLPFASWDANPNPDPGDPHPDDLHPDNRDPDDPHPDNPDHVDSNGQLVMRYKYVRTKWLPEEKESLELIALEHHFVEKKIVQDHRESLLPNR
ncbi:hypothetical protein A2U01_0030970, partial [Trifolium medium]|nr:hypothetical protein [Trifolium medium]